MESTEGTVLRMACAELFQKIKLRGASSDWGIAGGGNPPKDTQKEIPKRRENLYTGTDCMIYLSEGYGER